VRPYVGSKFRQSSPQDWQFWTMENTQEYLYPRRFKFFSVGVQIFTVALLFAFYTLYLYFGYKATGTMFGYPLRISILFAPIYEEVIFRGIILIGLTRFYPVKNSIVISSLLFGLWHFKNIFFISTPELAHQILYTALIFGPVIAWVTVKTKSIWPAIILHYLNNILAPLLGVLWAIWLK